MSEKFGDLPEVRRKGLETMEEVYGFEMTDGEGDFFRYTADHLFADIWNRPGLSNRDRRLLLIGPTEPGDGRCARPDTAAPVLGCASGRGLACRDLSG